MVHSAERIAFVFTPCSMLFALCCYLGVLARDIFWFPDKSGFPLRSNQLIRVRGF